MDVQLIGAIIAVYLLSLIGACLLTAWWLKRRYHYLEKLRLKIKEAREEKQRSDVELAKVVGKVNAARETFSKIDADTKDLQALRLNAGKIADELATNTRRLEEVSALVAERAREAEARTADLHSLLSKIDLYSRVDDFVEYGHFEVPEYLYETSERFAAEIKILRDKQKGMIKAGTALVQDEPVSLTGDDKLDKKIIDAQMKLILRAFNIESDLLIAKVGPSNFDRTLGRIEKLANDLEKLCASLRCGISIEYVTAKYEECGIQYQYTLKKKDEQEEQKLIREQMREEARAEKEYRDALAAAEKEEKLYRDLLEKAREELSRGTDEERVLAEARIAELERQLADAEQKEQRAKSLAEQTRRGHVYVISNIGSFGENVYKIGMTRRLDPMDRVKELGDASVPFSFDVHAVIFAEDAPAMEAALHRKFGHHRVNAVNLRKEFFRVKLDNIREAVAEISGDEVEFRTTIAAEEYYETQRLRETSTRLGAPQSPAPLEA